MEHRFAISSGTPDTGCRLPPASHPVVFSFLIVNNATRASFKKLIFLDLATSSYGSPQSIHRCMLFFSFFSSNQAFLPTTWLTSRKLGSRKMSSYQQKLLEESQSHSINLQRSRLIPLLPPRSQNFRFIYRLSCYAESSLRVEKTFSKKTFLPRLLCNF